MFVMIVKMHKLERANISSSLFYNADRCINAKTILYKF